MASSVPSTRRRFSPGQFALHAEAATAMVLASLAIRLLSFPRVTALGARPAGIRQMVDVATLRGPVRGWGRRVPWRALCFESALALRLMLARRGVGSTLHYGIAQSEGLKAHVWLSVDGDVVIGGAEADGFTEVGTFPPRPTR
jgi:hypothetical protein